jgi:hypothetical protein
MCSIILLRQPANPWPLVIAANRDEMAGRPWRPPGRHWPDRPDLVGGLDELAGGSWLGINDSGVMAAMLNRMGTLGPEAGKRSRGELVLEALDHADALDAAKALSDLDPSAYRPFNQVVGDSRDLFWIRNDGRRIEVKPIPEGVHMLTAYELNDKAGSPRIAAFLGRFRDAPAPDPESGDWHAWIGLLGARSGNPGSGETEEAALCIDRPTGFGTVSSALIAIPSPELERPPVLLFAAGKPDQAPFLPVVLTP